MELALQDALDAKVLALPTVVVDFSRHDPKGDTKSDEQEGRLVEAVGRITSLQVPHRLADAILRDSEFEGKPFRDSEKGRMLSSAGPSNATPVYILCPTALLLGMWDSTGPKGGLGPKFERVVVSEIVGVGAEVGDLRRGVRRDPLEIRAAVKVVKKDNNSWEVADPHAKGGVAPSKLNHSSVPYPEQRDKKTEKNYYNGVTIEYAEQTTTLSLIALRRLRFPVDGKPDAELDAAARTALAALGLCAATLAFESGADLRSRCLLWPEGAMQWQLLDRPGEAPREFDLSSAEAIKLLAAAVNQTKAKGLTWEENPVELTPSDQLVKLVRLSQLEAVTESTGTE